VKKRERKREEKPSLTRDVRLHVGPKLVLEAGAHKKGRVSAVDEPLERLLAEGLVVVVRLEAVEGEGGAVAAVGLLNDLVCVRVGSQRGGEVGFCLVMAGPWFVLELLKVKEELSLPLDCLTISSALAWEVKGRREGGEGQSGLACGEQILIPSLPRPQQAYWPQAVVIENLLRRTESTEEKWIY
jgi:hypothetical protein